MFTLFAQFGVSDYESLVNYTKMRMNDAEFLAETGIVGLRLFVQQIVTQGLLYTILTIWKMLRNIKPRLNRQTYRPGLSVLVLFYQ